MKYSKRGRLMEVVYKPILILRRQIEENDFHVTPCITIGTYKDESGGATGIALEWGYYAIGIARFYVHIKSKNTENNT